MNYKYKTAKPLSILLIANSLFRVSRSHLKNSLSIFPRNSHQNRLAGERERNSEISNFNFGRKFQNPSFRFLRFRVRLFGDLLSIGGWDKEMASENNLNDATSFQQSDAPILCANGCGFFGTAAMMNLCSKCYRDYKMTEEQAATAKAAVEKSMSSAPSSSLSPKVLVVAEKVSEPAAPAVLVSGPTEEEEAEKAAVDVAVVAPPPVKATNRCGSCNKKVGIVGFKCRCGITFCGSHRYPEEHSCSVDYKGAGRDAIAKANPVVKADKVERF